MIRHLLRIVWNRRRANALIALELLLSFLVLAAVVTMAVYLLDNYRQPLGFVYEDVWSVRIAMNVIDAPGGGALPENAPARRAERLNTLMGLLRDMPEVVSVSPVNDAPYSQSSWESEVDVGGRRYTFSANRAGDQFAATMRLTVTRGRWFDASDDGAAWEPVVVNERLARELFGGQDPVGRTIQPDPPKDATEPAASAMRVVGVISDYRKAGEFSPQSNWLFYRTSLGPSTRVFGLPRYFVVRAKPGTQAAFEARLVERLNTSAPDMSFRARPLVLARATMLRGDLPVLAAYALVAAFLLAMVVLGLTGVLWLTVTQRTREIGLRRAKGATIRDIRHQVLGEVLVIATAAVAAGIVIVAQFPLLDLVATISPGVYAAGLVISVACIYLLSIACAWAPSRLATSLPPAEALRYE
jgi:putative ABC transport system permease protein